MKKLLTITILSLLWFMPISAEDNKWQISTMTNGKTALARMNGNITHGDTLIYSIKNINGKCEYVQELFTFYTAANNPDIKKIEDKIIPIKFNEEDTHAKAAYINPFLIGHRVMFDMGVYEVNKLIDHISKYKTYNVTIVNELNPKSAEQSNMIENFKAVDYFDVPNNSWNLKDVKETILQIQKLCLEYKETKKNITESKQGTKTYADGSKYVGQLKNGKRHGQGTYIFKNGITSSGEWKNNKAVGSHTITDPNKVGEKALGETIDEKNSQVNLGGSKDIGKVNLNCSMDGKSFIEPVLDFDNSTLYNKDGPITYHMVFDEKSIQIALRTLSGDEKYKVKILEISRMTGNGMIKQYMVSDEEYAKIGVKFATRMRFEGVDNFDDKSLDPERYKIIAQTKLEYVKGKEISKIKDFKCEKIEVKKF